MKNTGLPLFLEIPLSKLPPPLPLLLPIRDMIQDDESLQNRLAPPPPPVPLPMENEGLRRSLILSPSSDSPLPPPKTMFIVLELIFVVGGALWGLPADPHFSRGEEVDDEPFSLSLSIVLN